MRRAQLLNLSGRRVFITGAASGIGRATAIAAGAQGAELFLTDIDSGALDEVAAAIANAGGRVGYVRAVDISDYAQVTDLADHIHAHFASMDVVMNVAGVSTWGTVDNLEHRHWKSMVDINLMGPIHVIETFLPPMIAAGRGGHLVNVSSAAGLIGMPWHAAYSASKFGLRGISEVLRFDLRRHHIGVSLVCPGGVATPLTETVEIAGVDRHGEAFKKVQARFRRRAVTPERAAQSILVGIQKHKYMVYTSNDIRVIHWIQRQFPPLYALVMTLMNYGANAILPMPTKAPAPPEPAVQPEPNSG